ncbi:hypothetical protein CSOJ01_16108 [Colletotrichum sojae]|uniref:Uncharacterized protein n=1 Tax=Colletotrichum sojae TaxID=2175907 RepID=A0A8H6MHQ4_9PEZI|nr:hypothetical protein CSOJ01_16108 [Colletotrichum sojae]
MQLSAFVAALLASAVSARTFTLFEHRDFGGSSWTEQPPDDARCWNMNGKGDQASSVLGGPGCTTFFRNRDCQGDRWT